MAAVRFSIKCFNRNCQYFFDPNKPHDREAQSYDAIFEVGVSHYENKKPVHKKPTCCKYCKSKNINATELLDWDEGSGSRINFGVDYYALLGGSFQRGVKTPKVQFFRRIKEIDREYREIETKRVRKEIVDYLNKIGTPQHEIPSKTAHLEGEICSNKNDKFFDEKVTLAFLKLQHASDANEILHPNKEKEKRKYDQGYYGIPGRAICYRHKTGEKVGISANTPYRFHDFLLFCSQDCLNEFIRGEFRRDWLKRTKIGEEAIKYPNDVNSPCHKCGIKEATSWKKRKNGRYYCQTCYDNVPNCHQCGKKKGWYQSSQKGSERFCSQDCLNQFAESPPDIAKLRANFIKHNLENLTGWGKLTFGEQTEFINQINVSWPWQFDTILQKAQEAIKAKPESDDTTPPPPSYLDSEIQDVISKIETELNKKPQITSQELDAETAPISWKDEIKSAHTIDDLKVKKANILAKVESLRRAKIQQLLEQLRTDAIQQIKNALVQQPPIDNNELKNPNWEDDIKSLSDENQIKSLRDNILGEIKQKRDKKEIESRLDDLIRQGQEAVNDNNLAKLGELLTKIETYQSTKSYEDRKSIIKELEKYLATTNLPKYKELIINSLDELLRQDPPLSPDELEETNQNFAEQIKDADSDEEIQTIKNSVINNVNKGRSNKIVINLINQAKQAKTEEQKSAVRQKYSELENSENQWIKAVLAAKKDELEKIMNSWILAEILNNNTKPPSPDKGKPDGNLPLIIFLVVVIGGIIISGLLIIRKRLKRG